MRAELAELVEQESFSSDLPALHSCADLVAELGARALGSAPRRLEPGGRPHLLWPGSGNREVLVLGHFDTVWPTGTLAGWPFTVDGDLATGPGVFDMKAGIVQMFAALRLLPSTEGVAVLLTSDEEIGAPSSRKLIEDTVRGCRAVLVPEPSAAGALKTARKGIGTYRLDVRGRAAHAGLEPEKGINATVELAHQVLRIAALGDSTVGTSVTPTVLSGGSSMNTVPEQASVQVDVRAWTAAELARVDAALRELEPVAAGAALELDGGVNRYALEASHSADLFGAAAQEAAELGLAPLRGVAVGGGSDGNFTAGLGVPTLDGLGAVGDHAHAPGEYADLSAMPQRAALMAALVGRLLGTG
ncbi:M20 family metallopeptidase [Streptomyces sp. 142MFCol3.1]|uniref:M20 family metallopeptidase n=1 Tax=Streptomyces sp. 142MFCol3.1 TaxID=1172179 RepID=UPI00056D540D|nr:M20 family metallopeptidase [Streptomyces sp. 142MFCol3.1]